MTRIIVVCGVIAGAVIIGSIIISLNLALGEDSMTILEWLGFLIMFVAFSMIFVGIKRYRDLELGGVIRFGRAVLMGLGISLVASVIYVIVWEVNLSLTDYAFVDDYTQYLIAKKEADGVTGAELEAVIEEMDRFKQNYANPLFRVPMTFLEIFPVGLLITLLSAAILRNSKVLPAVT